MFKEFTQKHSTGILLALVLLFGIMTFLAGVSLATNIFYERLALINEHVSEYVVMSK